MIERPPDERVLDELREAIVSANEIRQVCTNALGMEAGITATARVRECRLECPSLIEAGALCRHMGWEPPCAVSTDVHQVNWKIHLRKGEAQRVGGHIQIRADYPRLGERTVEADLRRRPPGNTEEFFGPAQAFDLTRHSAEVARLRIMPGDPCKKRPANPR
jgi:hypothetical protein